MVERWKAEGCPPDQSFGTSATDWVRTVGGILMVNDFRGFLGNLAERKVADDPARFALGTLGHAVPGEWLTAKEWAVHVVKQGLVKALVSEADRDTAEGRARGIGVVLSRHHQETLAVETDEEFVTLKLEKCRRRFGEQDAKTRYRFVVLEKVERPAED